MRKPIRPDLPIVAPGHMDAAGKFIMPGMPRKLMLQLLGLTAGLSLSVMGYAVGLGSINVVSALGQPLKAEIELIEVTKSDKPSLVARLASPDAYKGAGLEYPFGVKYSFDVGSRANGEPYLVLSSNREINDPFVSLLVELSWASGKLMREYTFLLDPPGYVAAQPGKSAVEAVAPVQSAPPEAAPRKPAESSVPARPPAARVERPIEKRVVQTEKSSVATGTITVKGGDTLNKIAAQNKPDDISLERMLVALYRANADQFDGQNMNRIRSGKILRMPGRDEVASVVQADAVQEIRAQVTDWNAYRQKLAGAATTSRQPDDTRRVATGKVTAPVADKTPVVSESAKEVLRLSKGEAPGDKTGAAGRSKTEQRNAAAEEDIAKTKAVEEAKTRAALLEANLSDMQRLAQLKSEAAALAASAVAAKATDIAAVSEVASAVSAVSQVAASHVVSAVPAAVSAEEESWQDKLMSLLDAILGSPVVAGAGAAALLGLGGLGVYLRRRKPAPAKIATPDEDGATTGHLTVPVAPSPDTGDFTAAAMEEVVPHPDDVDPISEADLFLNFGRDEQAEEVLKDAMLRTPDNHQLHLKLLGIYANRQDAEAFSKIAAILESSGDTDAIRQAEELALKLNKEDEVSIEDAGSATQRMSAFDIDLDMPLPEEAVLPESEPEAMAAPAEAIDFDVTSTHPVQTAAVDFDVTSTSPIVPDVLDFDLAAKEPGPAAQEEEALPSLDDLIFDVMPSVPEVKREAEAREETAPDEDDGMEFTLDFPLDDIAEKTTTPAPVINLSDISLDMDEVSAPAAEPLAAEKSEQWHEVATKLDLAKAYQEMGDEVGAREILDEVMLEGDEAQRNEAQQLISQLS